MEIKPLWLVICTQPVVFQIGLSEEYYCSTCHKFSYPISSSQTRHLPRSLIYVCPTPIQESLAIAFESQMALPAEDDTFFVQLREDLRSKRSRVAEALKAVGLKPLVPEGGYFITVDVSNFDFRKIGCDIPSATSSSTSTSSSSTSTSTASTSSTPAATLIRWMLEHKRLVVMPTWPFYSASHRDLASHHVRICFNKKDETIDQAVKILEEWARELNG